MGEVICVNFRGKGSKLVERIHDPTYISKSHIENKKAMEDLLNRSRVDCVSCNKLIEGINKDDLRDYPYYIDGGGPLHPHCYHENIMATGQFAKALDKRRYK